VIEEEESVYSSISSMHEGTPAKVIEEIDTTTLVLFKKEKESIFTSKTMARKLFH